MQSLCMRGFAGLAPLLCERELERWFVCGCSSFVWAQVRNVLNEAWILRWSTEFVSEGVYWVKKVSCSL